MIFILATAMMLTMLIATAFALLGEIDKTREGERLSIVGQAGFCDRRTPSRQAATAAQISVVAKLTAVILASSAIMTYAARAQDSESRLNEVMGAGFVVELGGAGGMYPSYEGADHFRLSGTPIVRLEYLRLPNGFQIGGGDGQGWSFRPSVRYVAGRSASDYPELLGLPDVSSSFELGGGVAYRIGNIRPFVDLRQGVSGHSGLVGESGIDLIFLPAQGLTMTVGPRLNFASRDYMDAYFGVTAAGAAASGLPQFSPSGGIRSAGIAATSRFEFNPTWAIEGTATWNRIAGDPAASPIVSLGSRDQFTAAIGLMRRFRVDLPE